jgi:Zn-dependent protease with chaperone function
MSRPAIIAMVCLAAYCLLDVAISAFVAIIWRTRAVAPSDLPPSVRARRLLLLRATPAALSAAITLLIVAPAFTLFEPIHDNEPIGPVLAVLSAVAGLQLSAAVIRGWHSARLTARIEREWLASSAGLEAPAPLRAFVVDAASPIVALVGVFRPTLIAARSVIDACSAQEIAAIVAHERGHFDARDNLKRWMMASLPDMLRWTPMHAEMVDAWHHAAEDAADDAATDGDAEARADLAALLLKVVRLAPHPIWNAAVVSPFVEHDGLERRVRRLIKPELEPPAPLAIVPVIAASVITLLTAMILSSPSSLEAIFIAFEHLVAVGR